MLRHIVIQLGRHVPFTAFGALTGIAIMVGLLLLKPPHGLSHGLFWALHPLHVLISALTTTAMYKLSADRPALPTAVVIGYIGSIGIATLSDSIIPFLGEWMLDLPSREIHIGFIEKWWLVNPLAIAGIFLGWRWPMTKTPHAGHVLLSTWASLFHMSMAMGSEPAIAMVLPVTLFLFLAVWVPCCTSDIIFPLIFVRNPRRPT